jgi:hypothetical protein
MQIRLPGHRWPAVAVFGGIAVGALLAVGTPRLSDFVDRPSCPETVMKAVSSEKAVSGTYDCFEPSMKVGLASIGIQSDEEFAVRVGQNGDYRYLQKTEDGGYVYEYDRPTRPHDKVLGALNAIGLPSTSRDLRRGDLGAAWAERHDLGAAWAEITGQTQRAHSQLFTFYLDPGGKISAVK